MAEETLEALREKAMAHVHEGQSEEAAAVFAQLAAREPDSADSWINLASLERDVGRFEAAAEHFRKGIALLRAQPEPNRPLIGQCYGALGTTLQSLELTGEALAAFREAAKIDPRAPQPLAMQAQLLARAGALTEADKAATAYCMTAVSVLSEKENIGQVRRFQKAMKEAASVDGLRLLAATREAYAKSFDTFVETLPKGVRLEEEPQMRAPDGRLVPALANHARPFSRVRFDAVDPATGQRWMIHETPTYGYPKDCAAAAEGFFSVPLEASVAPFKVLVATRTAWDYFYVRLRFVNGLSAKAVERAETLLGGWYGRGESGGFGDKGRGFFHFLSEPYRIGTEGLRYEVDLGLARFEAALGLLEALTKLHESEPIEVVVLGDGVLPPR